MRRVLALVLVIFLGVHSALAGVKKDQAKFIGGSESLPPTEAMGFVNTEDAFRPQFQYKAGKNSKVGKYTDGTFSLPYATVGKMIYGQEKHMRVGQTIALSALAGVGGLLLLLSKSHAHFLTIDYKDASRRRPDRKLRSRQAGDPSSAHLVGTAHGEEGRIRSCNHGTSSGKALNQ